MWQLNSVEQGLDSAERWLERVMTSQPGIEVLRDQFTEWMNDQGREQGLNAEAVRAYELANPPGMSADGLQRYWNKYRGLVNLDGILIRTSSQAWQAMKKKMINLLPGQPWAHLANYTDYGL